MLLEYPLSPTDDNVAHPLFICVCRKLLKEMSAFGEARGMKNHIKEYVFYALFELI